MGTFSRGVTAFRTFDCDGQLDAHVMEILLLCEEVLQSHRVTRAQGVDWMLCSLRTAQSSTSFVCNKLVEDPGS